MNDQYFQSPQDGADAEYFLSGLFPHLEVNLAPLDPELAVRVYQQYLQLAHLYPEVVLAMNTLRIDGTLNSYEIASARQSATEVGIKVNRLWTRQELVLQHLAETRQRDPHRAPMVSPEGVIVHEFGHLLDSYLRDRLGHTVLFPEGQPPCTLLRWLEREHLELLALPQVPLGTNALRNPRESFADGFAWMLLVEPERWPDYVQRLAAVLEVALVSLRSGVSR